jgi:hypothetical protein
MGIGVQKGPGFYSTLNVVVIAAFAVLSVALFQVTVANCQIPPRPERPEPNASRHNDRQVDQYIPLILRQMEHLRRMYGRYDTGEVPLFIWCNDQVWWELYKGRSYLRELINKDISAKSATRIWTEQYRMETEVLSLLISDQMSFLIDELDLSEDQVDEIETTLRHDAIIKHRLFREIAEGEDPGRLFERIDDISVSTEARLLRILLPEQHSDYLRLKFESQHPTPTHVAGFGKGMPVSEAFSSLAFTASGLRIHSRN